jgi:hypothetical protein
MKGMKKRLLFGAACPVSERAQCVVDGGGSEPFPASIRSASALQVPRQPFPSLSRSKVLRTLWPGADRTPRACPALHDQTERRLVTLVTQ